MARTEATGEQPSPETLTRNWDELLQEIRVTQTGVAILFSMLLTVPFSARFEAVDPFGRRVYLVALVLAAASVVVLIGPVAFHRLLFAQGEKAAVVATSHRMAQLGLVLLGLAVAAVVLLVTDVLLSRGEAVATAAAFALGTASLWLVPALVRRRSG